MTRTDGRSVAGTVLGERGDALQLRSDNRMVHLLRRTGARYRAVTSQTDWTSYHGRADRNRHSQLTQITPENVPRLAERWRFTLPGARQLQVTPLVSDGVTYVTAANEMYALDACTGTSSGTTSSRAPRGCSASRPAA